MDFTLAKCSTGVKRGFVDFTENLIFYLPDAFLPENCSKALLRAAKPG